MRNIEEKFTNKVRFLKSMCEKQKREIDVLNSQNEKKSKEFCQKFEDFDKFKVRVCKDIEILKEENKTQNFTIKAFEKQNQRY